MGLLLGAKYVKLPGSTEKGSQLVLKENILRLKDLQAPKTAEMLELAGGHVLLKPNREAANKKEKNKCLNWVVVSIPT